MQVGNIAADDNGVLRARVEDRGDRIVRNDLPVLPVEEPVEPCGIADTSWTACVASPLTW